MTIDISGTDTRLVARSLTLGYDSATVVDGLDLVIPDATITCVIGPNGCGKSTVLKALGRLLPVRGGHVLLDNRRIDKIPTRQVAQQIAVLPQTPTAPDGLTVLDLVTRGRKPHQSWLRQWSREDETYVADALARTGITELADRPLETLSGGQRQRAWIAMALAQQTEILLLDEPTTFLDLAHAIEVLELVTSLHRDLGRTVVMVLHDLNLAARYAHHIVLMKDGAIVDQGVPADVVTTDSLREVFGLSASVIDNPVGDGIVVIPN